jgi:hypothetical protein
MSEAPRIVNPLIRNLDLLFRRFAHYRVKPVNDWLSQEKGTLDSHAYSFRVSRLPVLAGLGARNHADGGSIHGR